MQENEEKKIVSQAIIQTTQNADTITLLEAIQILWGKKFTLFLFIILGAAVGFCISNWLRPQYTSDVLLQIDVKGSKAGKAMGEMGALLDAASPADAEIELIKSRMVLSHVVDVERLCFKATPVGASDRFMQVVWIWILFISQKSHAQKNGWHEPSATIHTKSSLLKKMLF